MAITIYLSWLRKVTLIKGQFSTSTLVRNGCSFHLNLGHDRCLTLARDNKIEIFCKMALSNDDSFGWHTANETTHADKRKILFFLFFLLMWRICMEEVLIIWLFSYKYQEKSYFFHKYVCVNNVLRN